MMPESLPRRFWPEDEWPATHGARGARCQAEMDSRRFRASRGGMGSEIRLARQGGVCRWHAGSLTVCLNGGFPR